MITGLGSVGVDEDAPACGEEHLALLGRFEEAVVLAALACGPGATAGAIKARLASAIGPRHINGVLTTLDRLSKKRIIETVSKAARAGLPGRRCKIYSVTDMGRETARRGIAVVADLARDAGFREAA